MQKMRYILIFVFVLLIIIELVIADYSNFWSLKNITSFIAPILGIIALAGSIYHVKKHGEN